MRTRKAGRAETYGGPPPSPGGRAGLREKREPVLGVAIVLAGCLLTFYLVGFLLIPLGAWLWHRAVPA